MAAANYYLCDVCSSKCFYDSDIDWDSTYVGEMAVICEKCSEVYDIKIVKSPSNPDLINESEKETH